MKSIKLFFIATFGILLVSAIPLELGKGKRLIKTSENEPAKWLTELEIEKLIELDQGFIDITDLKNFPERPLTVRANKGIPTSLKYQNVVGKAISDISLLRIRDFLNTFVTSFHNRYMNATTGVESEKWLLAEISRVIGSQNYAGSVAVEEFEHTRWLQNSIIVRIEGSETPSERVILGAHQDSINIQNGTDYERQYAPGADDNASGCAVLLEVLNCILKNNIVPRRTIELHWYAAEERGLLGSMEIAQSYSNNLVNVIGMLNYDVVGYFDNNKNVAIITDYVDQQLTQFLRILVDEYLTFGRIERLCGYACSDHASWNQYGYPAARPTQGVRNPQMHTVSDTLETVLLTQVAEFVKIGLGFTIELAEPESQL